MDVEIFTLCDAATDTHGKLNILGTFDAIWSKQVPAVHPHCSVALRLRFYRVEEGEHKIRINIINEDGQLIAPALNATTNIVFTNNPESSIVRNMAINIQGLKLETYGDYAIDLAIDGRQEASLPLRVRKPPEPTAPSSDAE